MRVEGEIKVGEAAPWAQKASSRINGHPRPMILGIVVYLGVFGVLMFAWMLLDQMFFHAPWWVFYLPLIVFVIMAIHLTRKVCRKYSVRLATKALTERDLPNPVFGRFELTEDGLVAVSGRVEIRAPWKSVSDVFSAGPYWVIIVDALPVYLPKRFFPDVEAEKAFIVRLTSNAPQATRDRSPAAVAFAQS